MLSFKVFLCVYVFLNNPNPTNYVKNETIKKSLNNMTQNIISPAFVSVTPGCHISFSGCLTVSLEWFHVPSGIVTILDFVKWSLVEGQSYFTWNYWDFLLWSTIQQYLCLILNIFCIYFHNWMAGLICSEYVDG